MEKTIETAMSEARAKMATRKAQAEALFRRTPVTPAQAAVEREDNDIDAYDVRDYLRSNTNVTPESLAGHFGIPLGQAQWMMM